MQTRSFSRPEKSPVESRQPRPCRDPGLLGKFSPSGPARAGRPLFIRQNQGQPEARRVLGLLSGLRANLLSSARLDCLLKVSYLHRHFCADSAPRLEQVNSKVELLPLTRAFSNGSGCWTTCWPTVTRWKGYSTQHFGDQTEASPSRLTRTWPTTCGTSRAISSSNGPRLVLLDSKSKIEFLKRMLVKNKTITREYVLAQQQRVSLGRFRLNYAQVSKTGLTSSCSIFSWFNSRKLSSAVDCSSQTKALHGRRPRAEVE